MNERTRVLAGGFMVVAAMLALAACQPEAEPVGAADVTGAPTGSIRAAMTAAKSGDDVAGVLFQVTCDDGFSVSQYVPLETEPLPTWLLPVGGDDHAFADLFQVVPAGTCTVTATPMQDPNTPSALCQPAQTVVTILPEQTTEIVLVMNCKTPPNGGLDIVGVLNHGPAIVALEFGPSKFIGTCEPLTVTVTAVDPDSDPMTYQWTLVSSPGGALPTTFVPNGASLEFAADVPGDYIVTVTVTDPFGVQASLTFPIHVSDDPSVDQCNDPCCRLPNGQYVVLPVEKCESAPGAIVVDALCEPVCCARQNVLISTTLGQCQDIGGTVVPDEQCLAVCCKVGDAFLPGLNANECKKLGGTAVVAEACEPACCKDGDHFVVETVGECTLAGAQVLPVEKCDEICCEDKEKGFAFLAIVECESIGGQPTNPELCKDVCCKNKDGRHTTSYGGCIASGGTVVPEDECIDEKAWQADHTMGPGEPCTTPYLVVPSSAANKLAVFDLATLQPLPGSPFPTCGNPSRILMDSNTDVIATCRNDGHVRKHRKDGTVVWDRGLPGCTAARGIVIEPTGRLFAGCSTSNQVIELDPATGIVLAIVDAFPGHTDTGYLYGLAADEDGVYAVDMSGGHLSRLHLYGPTDLQADWVVAVGTYGAYGLAIDGNGHVWTAASSLTAWDTATGALVATYALPSYGNGVTVSPSGIVWVGLAGANQVARLDPAAPTPTLSIHAMPAGDQHPRGVTTDASDNLYTINMTSNNVTRFDPGMATTSFGGGGILSAPYGYSGDMTGVTFGCLLNRTEWWYGPVLDGGEVVDWLDVTWTATTPPGTSVQVSWSLDGIQWYAATSGQPIVGATGQFFQIRALLTTTNASVPSIDSIEVRWQH